ncbi:uncharacterized protein [Typha latifolia]|uniref:uncharacterized protein n=1 Tax=Typha latifolia TaxID=4733 RepID=UPI003C2DFA55
MLSFRRKAKHVSLNTILLFSRYLSSTHPSQSHGYVCETIPRKHDIFWWNSAITSCFKNGEVENARKLFEQMPHRNVVTWNCMVSGFINNGWIAEAQKTFDSMPVRNVVSWTALLTGYAKCGRIEEARHLFNKISERNVACWNSMVSGYLRNGMISKARELFDEMPTKNSVSWSIMISGYLKNKLVAEARALFDRASLRSISLHNALLSGYAEIGCLKDAEELFGRMVQRDIVSCNVMLTCYARAGKMELAKCLFDEMPEKDTISWTTVMHGYLQNKDIGAAWKVFNEMPDRDAITWNTMMGGFVQNGMLDDALRLFFEMPERDIVSWNTILQGYVQQGDMVNAHCWFREMPRRSETSWNTLICGCEGHEALVLFPEMIGEGFKPDQTTLSVVISVCASLAALAWGRMLHLYAIRTGYEHDTRVMSTLLSMYSKCGLISDAAQVFQCIMKPDTITWNAMISTCAYHGLATEAFRLFATMTQAGFSPDHATFTSLLIACAHKGFVDEGCRYFKSMQEDFKLIPKSEHYSCMVDLLGRSGFISQAHDFTDKIPTDLQTTAWETLLSACKIHDNLQLGELAARKVLHDQLPDGGMYIVLSNIYAAKEMWHNAARIRSFMKVSGVKKETGCSWIELKGEMFFFSSNDNTHPLIEEICQEVDNISATIEETT